MFDNIPKIKMGIISVSRDCFLIEISEKRRKAVAEEYSNKFTEIYNCPVTVENEKDMLRAIEAITDNGVNALVVLLGNFGPETPETLIAKKFDGPVMYVASAEESSDVLANDRGDAYCGMLSCSYNLGLRNIKAYIPEYPVGTAVEIANMIADFVPVATALIGVSKLKVISFGPRPQDFITCNAPIQPLFDLGSEIEENSELDLLVEYKKHEGDKRIAGVISGMEAELGEGNRMPGILPKLAQYEVTLLDIAESHKGASKYITFANKCWPSFQTEFGFVPCYVNSRLSALGIPVACEVDIFGALSEYIGACVSGESVTLLDINNSIPRDMYEKDIKQYGYRNNETFMGFHCGNTPICRLTKGTMKYQKVMARTLEQNCEPNISRGTLEGDIAEGDITFFRVQGGARGKLHAYIAQGEVLPIASHSFGGIGVFAIPEMDRFYRHVLIEKQFPHHGAVVFGHFGKALFAVLSYLGVDDISYNKPKGFAYDAENPWA